MLDRRTFNKLISLFAGTSLFAEGSRQINHLKYSNSNVIISTWNNSNANTIANNILKQDGSKLLDALEKAINSVEEDPNDASVGFGGAPDSSGQVTLDACIMDKMGNAGSVTYLKDIINAVSVARKVMEETPHVILSGQGAQDFALRHGFNKQSLLTLSALEDYHKWKQKAIYKPVINIERHDTIGMLVKNQSNDISGACSTSGLAYKTPGRVGDSPIIGAGLFVDNEIGAATATGLGEVILKSCSSFLVVELMRQGLSPEMACKQALLRIKMKYEVSDLQVGLIAINKNGKVGAYGIQPGFVYAHTINNETSVYNAKSILS